MTEEPTPEEDTGRRSRRAKAKAIDYSKEQEFSDEDLFEDVPPDEPVAPAPKRGRPKGSTSRKSKASLSKSTAAQNQDDLEEMYEMDEYRPAKPVYTEKGYDPTLLPIRERFPFLPEYEVDGSPRIDLIVGRRPIEEKENRKTAVDGDDDDDDDDDDDVSTNNVDDDDDETEEKAGRGRRGNKRGKRGSASPKKRMSSESDANVTDSNSNIVEYEYLVKYKNRSYLHLEWKTGADLESMNKSAKAIYRRYVKKLAAGHDEELEDPNFDPTFAVPQKILAEEEQELEIELSDQELLEWEKEKEKELADDDDSDDGGEDLPKVNDETKDDDGNNADSDGKSGAENENSSSEKEVKKDEGMADWKDEDIDFSSFTLEKLQAIIDQDEPYYPKFEGCDNPYRDGYITEPPKKPRASYLFFQCTMRSYFSMRNPNASLGELMTIIGDSWMAMSEKEQAPFLELAKQEAKQYEKERALMEKAQRPNEMWQPLRRCLMVLDRISQDGFANIFLEPVDIADFPDYEEYVDTPMDLGTVRQKLTSKKYQAPEQFARDVRKVWNNCKIYNRHGSAIWHVADYMAKQFERLYHAWVLDFRERYLRWANPRARPWEHSCRQHDGKCGTKDEDLVLCDHCDAMYGYKCLSPPLDKLPTGVWHCPDCRPKLKSARGVRMMSAVSEQAARKRAELGDTPKRKINQKMYLVKWMGLGYEFCTWETKDDIGNPALIAEFHKLNNSLQDEPVMAEEAVSKVLTTTEHVNRENAGGSSCIPDLRCQLYAQSRAFEFTKFGKELPLKVCQECGPITKTSIEVSSTNGNSMEHPKEVLECLNEITYRIALKDTLPRLMKVNSNLPPLMCGEYEAVVPITSKGLMMNVGEINGSVAFLGYRRFSDGTKGPAEVNNIIRGVGDKIIAVDGISTVSKSFKEVIALLRQSGQNKYAIMRFLEARFTTVENDFVSVGNRGRYTIEELKKKFSVDRKRVIVMREKLLEDEAEREEAQKDDDPSVAPQGSDEEDGGSEGEFQPESDDEADDLMENKNFPNSPQKTPVEAVITAPVNEPKEPQIEEIKATDGSPVKSFPGHVTEEFETDESFDDQGQTLTLKSETTHSLAYRLLNIDVGYSSDEGGDEDCAYFIDGVDDTFTTQTDIAEETLKDYSKVGNDSESMVPVRPMDFSSLGERSKLVASIAITSRPPDADDFDENFPFPSRKAIEAKEEEARIAAENLIATAETPEKAVKKSTVKIEQISVETAEVVNVWANVESAAATLQLPLNELKRVLRGEMDEEFSDEVGGFRWQYAAAGATVTAGENKRKGSKQGKEAWLEFRDRLYDPSEPHIYKNNNKLRDYQVEGVNWLASTFYRKHGCILADEMGLGKTVQIVSYLEHLFRVEKILGPFLVVVPLSTIEHWRREFEGWTDMVCCVYHDRQRVWRDVLREYEWYYEEKPHTAEFLKFHVLVTTYDTLIGDFDVISQIPFRVAVVDEAHRLRNQKGKLLECMKEISAKGTLQHGYQSRVLMSGTPLQNDLNELWTLLNFIEPFKFPDLDNFLHHFGNMASREQVESLQRKISPFMLRRVKEDVAKDIPAKEETVIDVELTAIQKQYYRAIFEHNHAFLNMGAGRANTPKLMNIQMELRKVCNHPCLLEGVEHREQDRAFKEFLEQGKFDGKSPEEQQEIMNEHLYIQTSGKMVLMDKLLPKLRQEGHKVLVFSQMVRMLDWISEYCEFRHFPHERLDGRVRGSDRQKSIDRFNKDKDAFLFLLSTRAGGVGINLTAADICIIFDSDWNPQNDVQAQARCHRIGQTKDVRIYRLVTSRSFEQEMFDRASKKLGLEQAVLGTFGHDEDDDKPTNKEMEQLLKKGAYALLGDDNDDIVKQFCADDIDSILAKRTRTRVVEGTKTASWLNKQGMVVNKSKFTSDIKSANLDMDDPLFWQKVMPDFVTPAIMSRQLQDLSDEIFGIKRKKGRGRGRWRDKLNDEKKETEAPSNPGIDATLNVTTDDDTLTPKVPVGNENGETHGDAKDPGSGNATPQEIDDDIVEDNVVQGENGGLGKDNDADGGESGDDDEEEDEEKPKIQITRAHQRKIAKFMSDLKSMMEGLLDEAEDDNLPSEEKAITQKLLLTVSVREKIFNEEQRRFAKTMLKRLEGDRRRRCRTSDQAERFSPVRKNKRGHEGSEIREELRIVRRKIKKRRKKTDEEPEQAGRRRRKNGSDVEIGDDGYKMHSDDEAEWSDVADEIYAQSMKKKATITRKEARRRRQWAGDDDAATAAGRTWPALPRTEVSKVLGTLLDEVMKHDEAKGGIFSVPVPRDDFPEYYEQIKTPMDYGTMKKKLDGGEYRSAQAMQKDFILVMQNCLKFNAADSEIVQEARQQALMRPNLLRTAALKHDLFLSEDGSVLYIVDDNNGKEDTEGPTKKRGRPKKKSREENEAAGVANPKKRKGKKRATDDDDQMDLGVEDDDVPLTSMKKKKPRIKISLQDGDGVQRKKRKLALDNDDNLDDNVVNEANNADIEAAAPIAPKKRSRKSSPAKKEEDPPKRRGRKRHAEKDDGKAENDRAEDETEGIRPASPPTILDSDYLDVALLKKEREQLEDKSFAAARGLFMKRGKWILPEPLGPDKFREIALMTLKKIEKIDRYSVFSDPVSDSDAPGYSDVVKNPIDLSTIKSKIEKAGYGHGKEAVGKFYADLLLMFDNCRLYNDDDGEVTEEAARILAVVPEIYGGACVSILKKQKK